MLAERYPIIHMERRPSRLRPLGFFCTKKLAFDLENLLLRSHEMTILTFFWKGLENARKNAICMVFWRKIKEITPLVFFILR